jgi:hypothetical protein
LVKYKSFVNNIKTSRFLKRMISNNNNTSLARSSSYGGYTEKSPDGLGPPRSAELASRETEYKQLSTLLSASRKRLRLAVKKEGTNTLLASELQSYIDQRAILRTTIRKLKRNKPTKTLLSLKHRKKIQNAKYYANRSDETRLLANARERAYYKKKQDALKAD